MLLKSLEKSLWAVFRLFWILTGIIGLFILVAGLSQADLGWLKSARLGYAYKLLFLLLPFFCLTYPLMIDQLYPVRGFGRYFFYPWQTLIVLLIFALYLVILQILLVRLQVSLGLTGADLLPAKKFPLPEWVLKLSLPDVRGAVSSHPLLQVDPLFSKIAAVYARKLAGLPVLYWIFIFGGLYTAGVVWMKRSLPQNKTYQTILAFTVSLLFSSVAYFFIIRAV
ncbi:MAG: hypothetical protein JNM63_03320 [Spirochaetia bacterium]|nr:hypothetical protein [Spirochaetia bacterium]